MEGIQAILEDKVKIFIVYFITYSFENCMNIFSKSPRGRETFTDNIRFSLTSMAISH